MRKSLIILVISFVGIGVATSVWATPMTFDMVGNPDPSLTARVDFAYDSTQGTVSIAITNTYSGTYPDPRITAFAFNIPSVVTGSTFAGPSSWSEVFSPDSVKTPQSLGSFDIAGITGPNFSGGKPNSGIGLGNTFNFSFVLTGTNLGSLDEAAFLGEFSSPKNTNDVPQFFAVRWQRTGTDQQGSDVGIPVNPVPEPATIILLGSGLVSLGLWGRRKLTRS